jgi:hypothetical protein
MGYKTKKEVEEELAGCDENYPKSVYHKNFNPDGDEKNLLANHKVVKTESAFKKLGADWGEHPSLKDAPKAEPKSKLESKSEIKSK